MVRVRQAPYNFESKEIQFKLMFFMVSLHIGLICAGQLETNVCGTICKCENVQTVVRCENLTLTSVPKAIPETVTSLSLRNNAIKDIGEGTFGNLQNLKMLYLTNNTIKNIGEGTFRNLQHLQILSLYNNSLKDIGEGTFRNLQNLKMLNLGYNQITNIEGTFKTLNNLQGLLLDRNAIKEIGEGTFKDLPNLKILNLGYNQITNIKEGTFKTLKNLEKLYMHDNTIKDIGEGTFRNLRSLKFLHLSDNKITNIEGKSFQHLRNLEQIYLNKNAIKVIGEGTFKDLPNLEILNLGYNQITNIEGNFKTLNNLEKLYLHDNTIKDIGEGTFRNLQSLKFLHLSDNTITNIEGKSFQHLRNLQELYLNTNAIKDIGEGTLKDLQHLKVLTLGDNQITNIEGTFKNLKHLEKLHLSDNKITNIEGKSFQHLWNLQELFLNKNAIKDIGDGTLKDLPNLKLLTLGYNQITNIEEGTFKTLKHLEKLYLHDNTIKDIGEGTFGNHPYLKILHLSDNKITNIEGNSFQHLRNLQELYLYSNQIKECEDGAFLFLSNITNIDLRNNKDMICGCHLPAFVDFIKRTYNRHVNVLGYCHTVPGNSQTKLIRTHDPSHCKNYSLFQQKLQCQTCSGIMCNDSKVTSCSDAEPVCKSRISMSGVTQKTEKSCSTYTKCVEALRNNTFTCNKWTSGTSCSACCTGNLCNKKDLIGWNNSFVLNLLYTMNPYLTSDNRTRKSDEYISLLENISRTLEFEFLNLKGEYTVEICGLQQQIEIFTIYCRVLSEITVEQLKQDISNILNTSKTLRNLGIQRGNIELIDEMLCNENTTLDNDYTLAWPVTKVGNTVIIPCHGKVATRRCSSRTEVHLEIPPTQCLTSPDHSPFTGVWEEPDMSQCGTTDSTTRGVKQIKSIDIDKENIEDLSKQLLNISHKSEYFKEITNDLTERIMPRISNVSANTTTNYILLFINNMINTPEKILVEAEQSNKSVSRMLDIIRTIPEEIQLEKQQLTVLYSNLGIGVTKVEKDTFNGLFYGISCATNETAARGMIYMSSYTDQQLEDITMTDYISLPKSLLSHLKEEERSTISRITFSSLLNDKLYRVIQTSGNKTNSTIKQFINSRIMAANIPNIPMTNLDEPVTMSFSLLHKNATNPRCVYWDATPGHWSTKGCNAYNMVPGEKVSCSCNHLTSVALLMDVYQNEENVKNVKLLSVISNIGCGISVVFLVLTVIFHVCFKDLWKIIASKILVNYCSSLAVTYLIFLVGMPPYAAKTIVVCKAVAALLHYFLLVSIMWMTVEALHICLVVFVLSRTYQRSFMMRSSMFAWGLPAVIVILTLAINYTNNYIRIAEVCWLSRTSFYAAFLIPVVIILLFNLIIFSLIIWRLISMQNDKKFERKTRKVRVFGIVGLFFLLGLTWILAFFTFGEAAIVYKYLFAIFNTLQGLFIFIFYCIYNKDIRNIICMNVCKRKKYKLQRDTKSKTSRCSRSGNESDAGIYDNIEDSDL